MTLGSSDLQLDSDLDSIRNSCDVFSLKLFIFNDIKDDKNKDIEDNGNDDAHIVGTARH